MRRRADPAARKLRWRIYMRAYMRRKAAAQRAGQITPKLLIEEEGMKKP